MQKASGVLFLAFPSGEGGPLAVDEEILFSLVFLAIATGEDKGSKITRDIDIEKFGLAVLRYSNSQINKYL